MNDLWMTIVKASAPIVGAFACWALAALGRWARSQTRSETARHLLDIVAEAVRTAVAQTEQTFVRESKIHGGKMSANEADRARMIAISRAKRLMPDERLGELARTLGVSVEQIDGYFGDKIEAAVLTLKERTG